MESSIGEEKGQLTRSRLEKVPEIPALPSVLLKVWELTSQESTSAADLGKVMSSDPGLTGALLRLANSAYFGFPRKVSTVTQAIVILGFETVKSLAVGASVFRSLNPRNQRGIDPHAFFHHGLTTAMVARMLIEREYPQKGGTVFAAGILHDVGKLVVAEFLGAEMERILEAAAEVPWEDAEREVLGLTHAEIGFWFASRWKFPGELADGVRWHHRPGEATLHRDHASAVHLGDVIAHRTGAPGSGRRDTPEPSPEAMETLKIDEATIEEMVGLVSGMVIDSRSAGITLGM